MSEDKGIIIGDESGEIDITDDVKSNVKSKKDKIFSEKTEKTNISGKVEKTEVDTIKVRFKREVNCFFGEKQFSALAGDVKRISKMQFDILKQNPNNIELIP